MTACRCTGTKCIRDVWVEAFTTSASPGDRIFNFKFWNRLNNDDLTEDKVAFTAIGIDAFSNSSVMSIIRSGSRKSDEKAG